MQGCQQRLYYTQFSSHRDVLNQFSQKIEKSKTTLKNLNTQYNIKPSAALDQFLSLQLLIRLNLNVNTAPKTFTEKRILEYGTVPLIFHLLSRLINNFGI
jgi:hypothetical protein